MALVLTSEPRVTYAELSTWPEDGRRYELYDGEVRQVPAPLPRHQLAVQELYVALRSYSKDRGGLVLISPIDIVFDELNALQPDLVVFTADRRHFVDPNRVIRAAPDVAIEVISASTARHDRTRKLQWYERFGVQEFWMFDPTAGRMEIRLLVEGRYSLGGAAGQGETFASTVLDGFTCALDSLQTT
jgi:Uma2 family endonuclease